MSMSIAEQFVSTYFENRVAKAERAFKKAEAMLTSEYEGKLKAQAALQAQLETLRKERVAIEESFIEWQKLKQEGRVGGLGGESSKEINELWRTIRESGATMAEMSSRDQDRATDISIARVDDLFEVPQALAASVQTSRESASKTFRNVLINTQGKGEIDATDQAQVNSAVSVYLDEVSSSVAQMSPAQRLQAAATARASLEAELTNSGIKMNVADAVAKKFGLQDAEMTSQEYVDAQKEALKEETLKKAYSSVNRVDQTYQLAYKRLAELTGKSEEDLKARAELAAQFTPQQWQAVREDLLKDGVLDEVAPELRDTYLQLRDMGGTLNPQDDVLFDDLFLSQLSRRYEVQSSEADIQEALSRIDPKAPEYDQIREAAYALMPRTKMPMPALVNKPKLKLNGAEPVKAKDKDTLMRNAYQTAKSMQDHKPSITAKRLHNQIMQGAADRTQLYELATKVTGNPVQAEAIVSDVMWLDLNTK